MNRFRIGVGILALLLVLGVFTQLAAGNRCAPIAAALTEAAEAARAGDWQRASDARGRAEALWRGSWYAVAALADHGPMEDIDALFARLPSDAREDPAEFPALCGELARRVRAVADAHRLTWWNLL